MTNEQAKEIFNAAIENAKDPDAIAKLEIVREYFTNRKFRRLLEDYTFAINS